jgi:cytoskeletal protein RodZ
MEEYWQQPAPGRGRQQMPAPAAAKPPKVKKPKNKRKMLTGLFIAVIIIVFLGVIGFFIKRTSDLQKENAKLSNPTEVARSQQEETITAVGQIAEVPQDEEPTVATVSDLSKLSGQAFFKNAQVGDSVLVYTKAKVAYLYRPSTNKIVNIAPLTLGDEAITE